MTLKIIGAALLAAAGFGLGLGRLGTARRSIALLKDIDAALGRLGAEIALLRRPVPEVFMSLAESGPKLTLGFFAFLGAECECSPLQETWGRAVGLLGLRQEERRMLEGLGGVLGRYEAERQSAEVELVRSQLRASAEKLERELEGALRTYPALGLCAGAIAALLLI